eukprot:gene19490-14123_t
MSARQRARLLQSKQLAAIAGDDSSDAEDDYQMKPKPRKQKKTPAPAFTLPIGSSDEDDDSDASGNSDKDDDDIASPKDEASTSAVPERQPSNDSIFEDSSEDESPAVLVQKPSTFTQLVDSSSSSDDDTDDAPLQQITVSVAVNKKKSAAPSSAVEPTGDLDAEAFLEEQIRKNEQLKAANAADESNSVNGRKAFQESESILFTKIDPKQLNWDSIVRNRFGGGGLGDLPVNDVGNNQRNPPPRGNRMFSHRRWLFGQPDDDWGKPPSIIGGGMGMTRLHTEYLPGTTTKEILYNVFTFKWSKEYLKLASLYQIAKATGDPNYLVMFLANYPYYAEGFIDLGYIFFQMGLAVNMQGQIPLAANLATMILSLNPTDDVVHILLSLDYFLLQAGKYSEVARMCGMALEPTTLGEVRAMQRRENGHNSDSSSDSSDDESTPAAATSATTSATEDQKKRVVDLVQHHWHR